jgi:hypothetical protein
MTPVEVVVKSAIALINPNYFSDNFKE